MSLLLRELWFVKAHGSFEMQSEHIKTHHNRMADDPSRWTRADGTRDAAIEAQFYAFATEHFGLEREDVREVDIVADTAALLHPCLRVLVGQDCLRLPPTASARSSRSFFGITFAACCARVLCATGLAFIIICADGAGPGAASRARGTEYAAAGSLTPAPPARLLHARGGARPPRGRGAGRQRLQQSGATADRGERDGLALQRRTCNTVCACFMAAGTL